MATRWRWPPDSSAGRRCSTVRGSATTSSSSAARAARSARDPTPNACSGSVMIRCDRSTAGRATRTGSGRPPASAGAAAAAPRPRVCVTSAPSTSTEPEVGSVSRSASRAVVDLPEPDSPTSARVRPRGRTNDTSSTARSVPPPADRGSANSLVRWRTSSAGTAVGGHGGGDGAGAAQAGRRGEQRARVRVARRAEHLVGRALLDHPALRHDDDPVRAVGGDAEVVRDEQHAGAGARGQLLEVVEDLALHGDVEGAGRLVGHQQARLRGERDGDEHALPHAAGELVRVLARPHLRVGQPGAAQGLDGLDRGVLAVGEAVDAQHLGHLLAHAGHGVERHGRVLRHQADQEAADRAQLALRGAGHVVPEQVDAAVVDDGGGGEQPDDGCRGGRLARSRTRRRRRRSRPRRRAATRPGPRGPCRGGPCRRRRGR